MKKLTTLGLAVLVLAACQPREQETVEETSPATGATVIEAAQALTARVEPTAGNKVAGTLTFMREEGFVRVTGELTGLTPGKVQGIHIHEKGDCSDNANAAGADFNPAGMSHGDVHGDNRHAGDMGNLKSNKQGKAVLDIRIPMPMDAVVEGRAIVVHANADDFKTQPSGNSGARIGCGVIAASR